MNLIQRRIVNVALVVSLTTSMSSKTHAILIRHDRDSAAHDALADEHPEAGYLGFADTFSRDELVGGLACSATLVSPTKVVTAAHCFEGQIRSDATVDATQAFFAIGALNFTSIPTPNVASITVNPLYNAGGVTNDSYDVAVMTLSRPMATTPASILLQDPSGKVGTMVGYGLQGNGLDGTGIDWRLDANGNIVGLDYSQSTVGKRAAQNMLNLTQAGEIPYMDESFLDTFLGHDFDSPLGGHHNEYANEPILELEGYQSFGDSGGPVYADFSSGRHLVAVTSGGGLPPELLPDPFFSTDVDPSPYLSTYGWVGGNAWLALEGNRLYLDKSNVPYSVPEPSAWITLVVAFAWLLGRWHLRTP